MQDADEKTKAALRNNLEMAKLLGARIVTVFGSDVAAQIAQYAIVSNVSKIVIGRTNHFTIHPLYRSELLEKLTYMAPNIDVYIIPDMQHAKRYRPKNVSKPFSGDWQKTAADFLLITGYYVFCNTSGPFVSELGIFRGKHHYAVPVGGACVFIPGKSETLCIVFCFH